MSIYAVNGKEPIAAWIPSLDTAGNGTTTLTDLVGSNNGTLTDMDPATDWVADTGAGGVRALDFDGVNDHVTAPRTANIVAVSYWTTVTVLTGNRRTFSINDNAFSMYSGPGTLVLRLIYNNNDLTTNITLLSSGQWNHVVASYDGENVHTYHNGNLRSTTPLPPASLGTANFHLAMLNTGHGQYWGGRMDDIRIFDQALDAADVTALYAAGLGRGITFGGTIQTRRRRDLGGFGL